MEDDLETRTLTGAELEQAQNYSRKFWLNKDNAPSAETMALLYEFHVRNN